MSDFKRLFVWQKASELVVLMHPLLKAMPPDEKDDLTDQMRRAATSITSNLAESPNRRTVKDRRKYITHANGSALELESQLITVKSLMLAPIDLVQPCLDLIPHVERLINCYYRNPCPPGTP